MINFANRPIIFGQDCMSFVKKHETLILCGFVSVCQCAKYECDGPNGTALFFPVVGGKL